MDEWAESIRPVQELLSARFERLKLKGEPLHVKKPVNDEAIEEVQNKLQELFPGVDCKSVTKVQSSKNKKLTDWMNNSLL